MIGWHLMAMLILNRWKMEQQLRDEQRIEDQTKRDEDRRDANDEDGKRVGRDLPIVERRKAPRQLFAASGSLLEATAGRPVALERIL